MKKRWKPKIEESFWTIRFSLCIGMLNSFCVRPGIDQITYKSQNNVSDFPLGCYRTKREAQTAIKKLKKFIKEEL